VKCGPKLSLSDTLPTAHDRYGDGNQAQAAASEECSVFFTQMSFVYFFPLGGLNAAKASGKDWYAAAPHCSLVASTN
jgi:hypothetical protein